jgi:hypothetical protein
VETASCGICAANTWFRVHGHMERRCGVLFLATTCSQRLSHPHVGLIRSWANLLAIFGTIRGPLTTPMPPQFTANKRVHCLFEQSWLGGIVVSGQRHLAAPN